MDELPSSQRFQMLITLSSGRKQTLTVQGISPFMCDWLVEKNKYTYAVYQFCCLFQKEIRLDDGNTAFLKTEGFHRQKRKGDTLEHVIGCEPLGFLGFVSKKPRPNKKVVSLLS